MWKRSRLAAREALANHHAFGHPVESLFFCAFVLMVYLAWPTKNFYWDGIAFSLEVERPEWFNPYLVTANHLIYEIFGFGLYKTTNALTGPVRAHDVLRIANSVLAVGTAFLVMSALRQFMRSDYIAVCLAALLSFSATWWRFATDVNAYIPSVFFLLIALRLSLRPSPPPLRAGLAYAIAILFHQLAVFLYPALAAAMMGRTGGNRTAFVRVGKFSTVSVGIVVPSYCLAFLLSRRTTDFRAFFRWVTSHSPDAAFSFDIVRSAYQSALGHVRLLLGGRASSYLECFGLGPALLSIGLIALFMFLCVQVVRFRRDLACGRQALSKSVAAFPHWWRIIALWITA